MLQCPKCSSSATQPSTRRGGKEKLLGFFCWNPFRCRHCGHRFFTLATGGERRRMLAETLNRRSQRAFAGFTTDPFAG
ncbi:MAG: hypothetical protein HY858_03875 [Candidatus Solibacter usitatus]|nr:hypothetical protein [Candidatus Solibacter usitatus]